jgi:hypothetical protein
MLLKNYLDAVRAYLPRRDDQRDILNELSAHLQIKFDERQEELGRALTEDEQAAVLAAYGNPLVVAGRYGATNLGLAFGRQLIGPEVFLLYRIVLLTQFALTLIVVTGISAVGGSVGGPFARYLGPMSMQFVLTTAIFIAIERFKRRSPTSTVWNFPPSYMQPIPHWQSLSGFVVLSLVALWWAAVPYAPFLLLGPAASRVTLTEGWHAFYWPALVPLVLGAAQRLVTLAHPGWTGFQAATRLLTNGWGVVIAYLFLQAAPYVTPIDASASAAAQRINGAMWWNAMASFGLYWLINAVFMAYMCFTHAARLLRRRREELMLQQSTQSW